MTHAGKTDVSVLSDLTVGYVTGVKPSPLLYFIGQKQLIASTYTQGEEITQGVNTRKWGLLETI